MFLQKSVVERVYSLSLLCPQLSSAGLGQKGISFHSLSPFPGALLASWWEASGGIQGHSWSSWSRYGLRLPCAPGPQGRDLLSIPALLPKAASLCSACICGGCGQETAFWLPPGGSRALLVWCRLRSPRGPSTLVDIWLAVQVDGFCFYPSPSSSRRERACCPCPSGLGFCHMRRWWGSRQSFTLSPAAASPAACWCPERALPSALSLVFLRSTRGDL